MKPNYLHINSDCAQAISDRTFNQRAGVTFTKVVADKPDDRRAVTVTYDAAQERIELIIENIDGAANFSRSATVTWTKEHGFVVVTDADRNIQHIDRENEIAHMRANSEDE